MGMHGMTRATMVSYLVANGEPTKDLSLGEITRGNGGYLRCERAGEF